MASRVIPLGITSFLKASLKNLLRPVACPMSVVPALGHRWSSLLSLCVPSFYSLGSVLQLLTLPSSSGYRYLYLTDALPSLSLVSSRADALLPRLSWPLLSTNTCRMRMSSLLPRRMLGRRRNSWRMLCRRWLLVPSLVDALLPRACGPSSWQMLCRHGRLVFVGGCFAAVAAGCSYVLSGWMLCHHGFVYL